jgi:hypothetical protein
MIFAREDVARACRAFGPMLHVPEGIDGIRLLWALSGCESSFGANAAPRHEPAYDVGGHYAGAGPQAALLERYGSAAACSYGPWQLLLVNVQPSSSPDDMANLNRCAMATVTFLNRQILDREHPQTLEEIAEAYNSGKWKWQSVPPGVERYAEDCRKYYDSEPMPAAV